MMQFLYGNSNFNDLLQESYLAGTSILSGMEYLFKAELFNENDGMLYSSFFSLSIGIERFLKIAVVSEYMYSNNFEKPTEKLLRGLGHNLVNLLDYCTDLCSKYEINIPEGTRDSLNLELISFLSRYATSNRYQNLNKLTSQTKQKDKHPIHEWALISEDFLRKNIKPRIIEKELLNLYGKLRYVGYTNYLDFNGHPLLSVDLLQYQYVARKAKPYMIYNLIQTLRPIYRMLDKISLECNNGPNADLNGPVQLPYYGELFPFFFVQLDQLKRTKKWVNRYN